ncbi:MAG: hypothetical protein ABW168_22340 [Sedimenticola sp.]
MSLRNPGLLFTKSATGKTLSINPGYRLMSVFAKSGLNKDSCQMAAMRPERVFHAKIQKTSFSAKAAI